MLKQKPLIGILLITSSSALIVAMNGFAKSISELYDPIETAFIRNFLCLVIITVFIFSTKKTHIFKTNRIKEHIARTITGTIGLSLIFWGYSLMPMATMQSLILTGGIMTAALAPFILKEQVGIYRWVAVLLGFIGALVVIQPTGSSFLGWSAVIGLMGAFWGGTLVGFFLRSLGRTEKAWTSVFYFLLIGSIITLPYCLWTKIQFYEQAIPGILGLSIAGGGSLILKTQAYRYAEASLLSPFTYFSLLWAIIFGWIGFSEIPNKWVLIGGGIIIVSNLFILYREQSQKSR